MAPPPGFEPGTARVETSPASIARGLEPHQRIKLCFRAYKARYVSDESGDDWSRHRDLHPAIRLTRPAHRYLCFEGLVSPNGIEPLSASLGNSPPGPPAGKLVPKAGLEPASASLPKTHITSNASAAWYKIRDSNPVLKHGKLVCHRQHLSCIGDPGRFRTGITRVAAAHLSVSATGSLG